MYFWRDIANDTCLRLNITYLGNSGQYINWGDGDLDTLYNGQNISYLHTYGTGCTGGGNQCTGIWSINNALDGLNINSGNGLLQGAILYKNQAGTINSTIFASGNFGLISKDIEFNISGNCLCTETKDVVLPAKSEWEISYIDPSSDPLWQISTGITGNWQKKTAPFSNYIENASSWSGNSPIWLRKKIDFSSYNTNEIVWKIAVDNGYQLYYEGAMISSGSREGLSKYSASGWDFSEKFPFTQGDMLLPFEGVLSVIARDWGALTLFDMQIEAQQVNYCCNRRIGNLNTNLDIEKSGVFKINNRSWATGASYQDFLDNNKLFYTGSAGIITSNCGSVSNYSINYGPNFFDAPANSNIVTENNNLFRQTISLSRIKKNNIFPYERIHSNSKAWASYYVGDGSDMPFGNNNVFSYAIDISSQIAINGASIIFSGEGSNTYPNQLPVYVDVNKNQDEKKVPEVYFFTGNSLSSGSTLCEIDCSVEQGEPPPPAILCWTGKDITGADYTKFLIDAYKKYPSKYLSFDSRTSNTAVVNFGTGAVGEIGDFFSFKTGYINYNNFISGDILKFSLYPKTYIEDYAAMHLGNVPLYDGYEFSIKNGVDFTDITGLTNTLNYLLRDVDYQVWYPNNCLSGQPVGMFTTGSLMSFDINAEDRNRIDFIAERNNLYAFHFSLDLMYPRNIENTSLNSKCENVISASGYRLVSGYSYMLPNVVELQAKTGSSWIILDSQSGIYSILTGLEPTSKTITGAWLDSGMVIYSEPPEVIVDNSPPPPVIIDNEKESSGQFILAHNFTQHNFKQKSKYCEPYDTPKDVNIYWPSGFASGTLSGCSGIPQLDKEQCDECCQWATKTNFSGGILIADYKLDLYQGCRGANTSLIPYVLTNGVTCYICTGTESRGPTINKFEATQFFYRTGWNLDATGKYIKSLTCPSFDLSQIRFEEYRVVLKDFSGVPANDDSIGLLQKSGFMVNNINLFTSKSTVLQNAIISGDGGCVMDSDYTLQVLGIVPLAFESDFNYTVSGNSQSGVYNAFNYGIEYTPQESERHVYFNTSSGVIIDKVTGFLTKTFYASGVVSGDFNNQFFYDPAAKVVYFNTGITGYTQSGSGITLSGNAYVLNQNTINSSVIAGGVFANQTQIQYIVSGSNNVTGLIPNVDYLAENLTGIFSITGTITGLSSGGYLNYTGIILTGSDYISNNGNALYIRPTGNIFATARIEINTGYLNTSDFISINGTTITYNNDNLNFVPPSFFNNIQTLVNIINSGQATYNCTAYTGTNGDLSLVSILSGDDGNSTRIEYRGSGFNFSGNTLTGGKYFYAPLYPTSDFSGILSLRKAVTGIYATTGSGYLEGEIDTYLGFRDFTGIWDVRTGVNDIYTFFAENNLISGGNYYSRLTSSELGDGASIIQLGVSYNNYLNTLGGDATDVARITVSGINFGNSGSGISFELTGLK